MSEEFVHSPYVYKTDNEFEAGLAHAHVGVPGASFDAKLPNIGAAAEASDYGIKVFANAELASLQSTLGPATAKVGVAVDTGVRIGSGVEAKVLGTGFSLGRKVGISLFGSELSFKLW